MKTSRLDDQTLDEILYNFFCTIQASNIKELHAHSKENAKKAILRLALSARPEKQHEGFGVEHSILNRRIGYNSCIDDYTAALKEKLG